jgi:TrmH family RNA methyltransferase
MPSLSFMPTSLSNRRRKQISSLTRRKGRNEHNQTLIESRRALASAIEAGAPMVELVVAEDARHDPEVQSLVDRAGVPVSVTDPETLQKITDVQSPQGVLGVVQRPLASPEGVREAVGENGTVLLLDGVQDPGNVGTLVRTAAWFGVGGVIAGPGTAGLFHPKVMRAAAGGQWDVACARSPSLPDELDDLRRAGYALYGADLQGTRADAWVPRRPSALVLGSEAHGLGAAVLGRLDESVAIPGAATRRGTESLNVAVAAGILVYEWTG